MNGVDMKFGKKYTIGSCHKNSQGDEFVIKDLSNGRVYIEFLKDGSTKDYSQNGFNRNNVSSFKKVEVGNYYKLNCGIEVVVSEVKEKTCVVTDGKTSKEVYKTNLVSGEISWAVDGVKISFKKKMREGLTFDTNKSGRLKVIEYINSLKVLVEFENTGHRQFCIMQNIVEGCVADRSLLNEKPKGNYIYSAFIEDELVYIGRGQRSRYKHCASGASTSFYLNKMFFEGKDIKTCIVIDKLSSEDSEMLETFLIKSFKPKGNTLINSKNEKVNSNFQEFLESMRNFEDSLKEPSTYLDIVKQQFSEKLCLV
jgi:hypothetical protein